MSMGCRELKYSRIQLERYNSSAKKKRSRPRLEYSITQIRQFSLIKHLATLQIIVRSGRLWCSFSIYLRHQVIFQEEHENVFRNVSLDLAKTIINQFSQMSRKHAVK
jgi:hypothetical protein